MLVNIFLLLPNDLLFSFFYYFYFLDIHECMSDPCHGNATCHDTEGSFECQCDVGYSGNGFNCSSKTKVLSSTL